MRLAHLSDVHIVTPRSARRDYRIRARAVNFGRAAIPVERAEKLSRALAHVKANGAEHLVVSGDLTDLGDDAELAKFGELLEGAGLDPHAVTLVPGNHDAYTSPDGYERALRGPLARWARGSAAPGEVRVVDRGEVVLVPLDVTRHQSIVRSGGVLDGGTAAEVSRLTADPAFRGRCVVVVMHHPPFHRHDHPLGRYVDSLRGIEHVHALLAERPYLHVLHGHFHETLDRGRVFGAPAVAEDGAAPRVRFYDVAETRLRAQPLAG